jgi:hypothetical protein
MHSFRPIPARYEALVDLLDDRSEFHPRWWPFWGIKSENHSLNYSAQFIPGPLVSIPVGATIRLSNNSAINAVKLYSSLSVIGIF